MSDSLVISAGQHSVAGRKPENEDACGIRIPTGSTLLTKGAVAAIADGVSSCEAGREASESCITGFLSDYFSTPDSWTVKTSAQRVLGALNNWLYTRGHRLQGSSQGMICTFSALVLKSASAFLLHVGDSRIYRLRGGSFEQLTRDHQTVGRGRRRFLSRAMGVDPDLNIDFRKNALEIGDIYLLSTDGVHGFLDDRELHELIDQHAGDLEQACREIVDAAHVAGSDDNLTAQLIRIEQIPYLADEEAFYQRLTRLPFPPPLIQGMVLDGHRILREMHASKRTQVYLAKAADNGELVVLKTPSINYQDDAGYIDRFLHEEWVGRRINNPHVLKIREQKVQEQRQWLYYVTEYAEGCDLRQWMHDHPQPSLNTVRDIVEQIAQGLRAFHRLEMLHQDLKPENIRIDNHGTVKIIDFGSVHIAGLAEVSTPLEHSDGPLGTQNYTAPEYLLSGRGSNRSDLFSLGVIAYELFTGQLPYGDEFSPTRRRQPVYTSAREHREELPAWMDAALEKSVTLKAEKRHPALSEFLHDLKHPNPELAPTEVRPLIERNPLLFWKGVAGLLAIGNLFLFYMLLGA